VSAGAACRIVLVGMMGSGKSTIGRRLSEATGWRYVDNDELVMQTAGMSARALLESRGEGPMREAERSAAMHGLAQDPPVIVGIAGGAITDAGVRHAMAAEAFVVWLRAASAILAARAPGAEHRPWIQEGGSDWIEATAAERAPLYAEVADLVVDTDRRRPSAVARRIIDAIATLEACPPAGPR
jgi:shikimate kinase